MFSDKTFFVFSIENITVSKSIRSNIRAKELENNVFTKGRKLRDFERLITRHLTINESIFLKARKNKCYSVLKNDVMKNDDIHEASKFQPHNL